MVGLRSGKALGVKTPSQITEVTDSEEDTVNGDVERTKPRSKTPATTKFRRNGKKGRLERVDLQVACVLGDSLHEEAISVRAGRSQASTGDDSAKDGHQEAVGARAGKSQASTGDDSAAPRPGSAAEWEYLDKEGQTQLATTDQMRWMRQVDQEAFSLVKQVGVHGDFVPIEELGPDPFLSRATAAGNPGKPAAKKKQAKRHRSRSPAKATRKSRRGQSIHPMVAEDLYHGKDSGLPEKAYEEAFEGWTKENMRYFAAKYLIDESRRHDTHLWLLTNRKAKEESVVVKHQWVVENLNSFAPVVLEFYMEEYECQLNKLAFHCTNYQETYMQKMQLFTWTNKAGEKQELCTMKDQQGDAVVVPGRWVKDTYVGDGSKPCQQLLAKRLEETKDTNKVIDVPDGAKGSRSRKKAKGQSRKKTLVPKYQNITKQGAGTHECGRVALKNVTDAFYQDNQHLASAKRIQELGDAVMRLTKGGESRGVFARVLNEESANRGLFVLKNGHRPKRRGLESQELPEMVFDPLDPNCEAFNHPVMFRPKLRDGQVMPHWFGCYKGELFDGEDHDHSIPCNQENLDKSIPAGEYDSVSDWKYILARYE